MGHVLYNTTESRICPINLMDSVKTTEGVIHKTLWPGGIDYFTQLKRKTIHDLSAIKGNLYDIGPQTDDRWDRKSFSVTKKVFYLFVLLATRNKIFNRKKALSFPATLRFCCE